MKNMDDGEVPHCFTFIALLFQPYCWCRAGWVCACRREETVALCLWPLSACLCRWPLSLCFCARDPSVHVFVPVTLQCMFLCQAGHGLAHPTAVAQRCGVSWAVQLLWAVWLSLHCWKWPGCVASVAKENRKANKSSSPIAWKVVRHIC